MANEFLQNVVNALDRLRDPKGDFTQPSVLYSPSSSHFQSLLRLPRKISVQDRNHALVGLYIKQVLVQLNYTLINKSDAYGDQVCHRTTGSM